MHKKISGETEKPAISYVYFDFFYWLSHSLNPIEVLDKRNFFDKKRKDNWNVNNYRRKTPV